MCILFFNLYNKFTPNTTRPRTKHTNNNYNNNKQNKLMIILNKKEVEELTNILEYAIYRCRNDPKEIIIKNILMKVKNFG